MEFVMRYAEWILTPLVILALAGCSTQSSPLPYRPMDWGPSNTKPATTQPPSVQPPNVTPSVVSAWEVRNSKPWRYIVIHHSGTDSGNAATFHTAHKAKGWDGLGYHFVIDNGNGGSDGVVEVGYRWQNQRTGAHTGNTPGNEYNEYGIGICLVGNFNNRMPSRAQMESLNRLVCYLQAKYNIPASRVIGHNDAPNAATDCAGHQFMGYIRSTYRPYLAKR